MGGRAPRCRLLWLQPTQLSHALRLPVEGIHGLAQRYEAALFLVEGPMAVHSPDSVESGWANK